MQYFAGIWLSNFQVSSYQSTGAAARFLIQVKEIGLGWSKLPFHEKGAVP